MLTMIQYNILHHHVLTVSGDLLVFKVNLSPRSENDNSP